MLINGNTLAKKKLSQLKAKIKKRKLNLQLDILYIEKNPASDIYIAKKTEMAKKLGISVFVHEFDKKVTVENVQSACMRLNQDPNITGYFMQLPIGDLSPRQDVVNYISYQKDVDCLTSARLGYALTYNDSLRPATVEAIISIFTFLKLKLKSKVITIINDSNLIGKPLAMYLTLQGATVTLCNEFTKDLKQYTEHADIIITATGKPNLITEEMVNEKCIIIDAGISKQGNKVVGDVDFDKIKKKVKAITPVPGGVGPLTVACLFENLLKLYEERN